MVKLKHLLLGAAALGLSACQGAQGGGGAAGSGGSSLCTPFPPTPATTAQPGAAANAPPIATADPAGATDDCLHRWAYALAGSSDDASHVAEAAMAACSSSLARWNQQGTAESQEGPPIEAPSLITGAPTSPIAEHLNFAQGRALFYVVQARAGKCAAPPMANGAPVGLARD